MLLDGDTELLGETEGDMELDGLVLGDSECDGDCDRDGLTLADGLWLPDGLDEKLTETLGDNELTPIPSGVSINSLNLNANCHTSSVTLAISNVSPSSRHSFSNDSDRKLLRLGTTASSVRIS